MQCHNKRQEYVISSKGKGKSMWQGKRKKRACRNPGLPLEYCLSSNNSFPGHISVPKDLGHVSFDKTAVKWEEERPECSAKRPRALQGETGRSGRGPRPPVLSQTAMKTIRPGAHAAGAGQLGMQSPKRPQASACGQVPSAPPRSRDEPAKGSLGFCPCPPSSTRPPARATATGRLILTFLASRALGAAEMSDLQTPPPLLLLRVSAPPPLKSTRAGGDCGGGSGCDVSARPPP